MIVESYEDVIVLSGALRSNFWDTIHTAISLLLKRHPTGVIIDCAGITECTTEGADTFIDIMNFIEEQEARVIVARVPDHVREVIKAVPGVRSQLPIASTVEEARASLDILADTGDDKKKRKGHVESESKVVLYLTGDDTDRAGALAAVRMAQIMHAQILMVYVIIVPRELPLQAPLTKEEECAKHAFDVVRPILDQEEISSEPILERGRDVGTVLDELMEDRGAHTLVVALSTDGNELDSEMKLVRSIMQKVEQAVMFVRPPLPNA